MQLVDWDSDGDLDLLVFGLFEAGHLGWFYSRISESGWVGSKKHSQTRR